MNAIDVYESHQHKRTYANCLSVRVTVMQLVRNNVMAVPSDRVPSEILTTVNPVSYTAIAQNTIKHNEYFPYLMFV